MIVCRLTYVAIYLVHAALRLVGWLWFTRRASS